MSRPPPPPKPSFEALAEGLPQLVWAADPDGRVVYYNARWYDYTGIERGDFSTATWQRCIHPDDLSALADAWAVSRAKGTPFELEYRLRGRDGSYRRFLGRSVVVRGEDGVVWRIGSSTDVEEQRRGHEERALLRSEMARGAELLAAITDAAPIAIAYIDADQVFRFSNPYYARVLGRPAVTAGLHAREVLGAAQYERLRPHVERVLAGEPVDLTTEVERPGRERIVVRASYVPDRDPSGNVRGFIAIAEDVTARGRAEDALRAASERQRVILESITDAFFFLDRDFHLTWMNETAVALIGSGRTREEMVGHSLWHLFPEAVGTTFDREYRRALDENVSVRFTEHYAPLRAWYEVRAYPSAEGLAVYFTDATAQVEAQAQAERQRAWLQAVIDATPTALVLLEPGSGRVRFSNRAADRMAGGETAKGYTIDEYPQAYRLTDEDDVPLPPEQVPGARAARGEPVDGIGVVWHTPAGRFSLLAQSATLPPIADLPATVVLTLQDVTRLKEAERAYKQALRVRDEFLSIASHELRTPLTSLKLQVQRLRRRAERGERLDRDALENLLTLEDRQIDRLARLVEDMLDISRITSGKLELSREPMDLAACLRDVMDRVGVQLDAAGCVPHIDAERPLVGRWDRDRLEQVLVNLVVNAAKYGAGRPVHVRAFREGDRAVVTVRDEGRGIAPGDHERIFQRFERAVSSSEVSGLGLGLYIARQIIRQHGGAIAVESEPGQGATFRVELPLGPSRSEDDVTPP